MIMFAAVVLQEKEDQSPQIATFWCPEWSIINIYIADILLLSPHVAIGAHLPTPVL